MIVFSTINPDHFNELGWMLKDRYLFRIYNINSYDARFPMLAGIVPKIGEISDEAYLHDDSQQFEIEYTSYLIGGPGTGPFITLMNNEFLNGGREIVILQFEDRLTSDSIMETLSHVMSTRYGLRPIIIKDPSDLEIFLTISPPTFSVVGLAQIDQDYATFMGMSHNINELDRELSREEIIRARQRAGEFL